MKNNDLDKVVEDALLVIQEEGMFERFNGYAEKIIANINNKTFEPMKRKNRYGLQSYINIDNARKNKPEISLRYLGQEVARLDSSLNVTPKDQQKFNPSFLWKSNEGTRFRKFYRDLLDFDLHSQEHKDEFLILTEMGKTKGKYKSLIQIQPIKIDHSLRVQFPVGINAKGANSKGNIDILSRVRRGAISNIAVIELKNSESYLKQSDGIDQAIRYAVFLRELLRSPESVSKVEWITILGFKPSRFEKPMTFYATLMVPLYHQSHALVLLSKYGTPNDYATYIFPNGDKIQVSSLYYTQKNECIQIAEVNCINEVKLNSF